MPPPPPFVTPKTLRGKSPPLTAGKGPWVRGRLREGGGKGRQSERESGEEEEEEVDEPRRRGGGPLLLFLYPSLLAFVSINGASSTDQPTHSPNFPAAFYYCYNRRAVGQVESLYDCANCCQFTWVFPRVVDLLAPAPSFTLSQHLPSSHNVVRMDRKRLKQVWEKGRTIHKF